MAARADITLKAAPDLAPEQARAAALRFALDCHAKKQETAGRDDVRRKEQDAHTAKR